MKVTITYSQPDDLMYVIEGGRDWGIVGKTKAKVTEERTEVIIKAVPIRYGKIAIPEIRVISKEEELEGCVSGNEQIILVVPNNIVKAVIH